ncbi:MAG TPA: L,D-transpeptidase [Thermoanaerobaculia bacterium]|nr:L,D-transpeptidase [Thermoanaerobaculia bacterium]
MTGSTFRLAGTLILATMWITPALAGSEAERCRFWQRDCVEAVATEGLPPEAPRVGTIITVDLTTDTAYLFRDGEVIRKAPAATGSEKLLRKGSRVWLFRTPRGRHKVLRKIEDPVWRKPDWAFVEEGKPIPAADHPSRLVKGKLGRYALDLGDGILIHGSDDVNSFGRKVSHGCVRLPDEMLAQVFGEAKVGTDVYIFESAVEKTLQAFREDRQKRAAGGVVRTEEDPGVTSGVLRKH